MILWAFETAGHTSETMVRKTSTEITEQKQY